MKRGSNQMRPHRRSIGTVAELAAVILVIWGVLNEGKLIDFEDRLFQKIKSFFKN